MAEWEVEGTDQFRVWYESLTDRHAAAVDVAVDRLIELGPALGRPLVDTLETPELPNLKELRVGTVRVLFAFDPRRVAILLLGGNKADDWRGWYRRMVPEAVRLYHEHLDDVRREGEV